MCMRAQVFEVEQRARINEFITGFSCPGERERERERERGGQRGRGGRDRERERDTDYQYKN